MLWFSRGRRGQRRNAQARATRNHHDIEAVAGGVDDVIRSIRSGTSIGQTHSPSSAGMGASIASAGNLSPSGGIQVQDAESPLTQFQ